MFDYGIQITLIAHVRVKAETGEQALEIAQNIPLNNPEWTRYFSFTDVKNVEDEVNKDCQ